MNLNFFKRGGKEAFQEAQPFCTLTPKTDARNIDSYASALSFALKCHDVRNVAITGKYGAGKSTFLRTYFKNRKDVLWISLASFLKCQQSTDQIENDGAPGISDAYESRTERLLEFSIIQQMFYTAKPSDLPASRYKRLSVPPTEKFWKVALFLCLTAVSAAGLFQPDFLAIHIFGHVKETLSHFQHWIFWGAFSLAFILTVCALRILRDAIKSSHSVKVSLQNLGVELDGRSSIFNRMLDEIIYFFEITDYGIVIFEDIDRFGDTEIFTKLREINQLINNSKQIPSGKKPIRFIYALRDDVFSNKDKVKFFDFLVPILPVINASNSDAVLINDLKKSGIVDGADLRGVVKTIAPYISDMRLLGNVVNEFRIYRQMIPDCAKPDSLLGMIVFKNFYPAEFAKLHDNGGILVQVFEHAETIKRSKTVEISEKIEQIEGRIEEAKENFVDNVAVLNLAYASAACRYCGRMPRVVINHSWQSLCDLNSDEQSSVFDGGFRCGCDPGVNWQNVEKSMPGAKTYKERKSLIADRSEARQLVFKDQIASLKASVVSVERMTVKQMIGGGYLTFSDISGLLVDSGESDRLLFFALLSEGYLAEDFTHYISVFHPGRLGREDYYFKINVEKGARANWELELEHPEEVAFDLNLVHFTSRSILNFSMFTFLVRTGGERLLAFIDMMVGQERVEFDFVSEYLTHCNEDTGKISAFHQILKQHPEYIDRLVSESNYPDARLKVQIGLYIRILLVDESLQPSATIADYIAGCGDFSIILRDAGISQTDRMEKLIKRLGVKMRTLEFKEARSCGLLDVLIRSNAYEINSEMLIGILKAHDVDVSAFERRGYSLIAKSRMADVIKYIDDNFSEYLTKVYKRITAEKSEDEDVLIALLEDETHSADDKATFIGAQSDSAAITDITRLKTVDSLSLVLQNKLMSATWPNVLWCFEYWDKLDDELTAYLNNESVYRTLVKDRCSKEWDSVRSFALAVAITPELSEDSVLCLLKGLPSGRLDEYSGENATPERIDTLSRARKVVFSPALYKLLKTLGNDSHVALAACCPGAFVKNISQIEIDASDAILVFHALEERRHETLTVFINALSDLIEKGDASLVKCVAAYVSDTNYNKINSGVLKACFDSFGNASFQCKIIRHVAESRDDAITLLSKVKDPYGGLSTAAHRPALPYWDGIEPFLLWLQQLSIVSTFTREGSVVKVNVKRGV